MPAVSGIADRHGAGVPCQFPVVAFGNCPDALFAGRPVKDRTDLPPLPVPPQTGSQARVARMKKRGHRSPGEPSAVRTGKVHFADGVQKAHPHACALPLGKDNQTACTSLHAAFPFVSAAHCKMTDRLPVDSTDVALCGDHVRQLQIVMRLKKLPVTPVRLVDFKVEPGALNPHRTAVFAGRRIEYPIRLYPVQNIPVAGQDQALLTAGKPAPRLGERQRAEPGDLSVKSAGELINNDGG